MPSHVNDSDYQRTEPITVPGLFELIVDKTMTRPVMEGTKILTINYGSQPYVELIIEVDDRLQQCKLWPDDDPEEVSGFNAIVVTQACRVVRGNPAIAADDVVRQVACDFLVLYDSKPDTA